mgnify:CR=1 FL=1
MNVNNCIIKIITYTISIDWYNPYKVLDNGKSTGSGFFIKDNYISKEKVKETCNDIITFIRITCGCCNDIGRKFMKEHNLKKSI